MSDTSTILSPASFPQLLREIPDPPKILHLKGEWPGDDKKYLCIVGSRKYSSYGKDVCEHLISGLKGSNIVIVSGLALGIDSIAHRSALEHGIQTVAVPGSGLAESSLYPSSHKQLAKQIVQKGGALLSEYNDDQKAAPWTFPKRNRIMAAVSHATLVIEAQRKSGTLITARLAYEYNRDVLAVPGHIFSHNSGGPHYLLRSGAVPITSSHDILDALDILPKQEVDTTSDCSPTEKEILKLLSAEPCSRDTLITTLTIPTQEISSLLSLLEIKGLVRESGGKIFRI